MLKSCATGKIYYTVCAKLKPDYKPYHRSQYMSEKSQLRLYFLTLAPYSFRYMNTALCTSKPSAISLL